MQYNSELLKCNQVYMLHACRIWDKRIEAQYYNRDGSIGEKNVNDHEAAPFSYNSRLLEIGSSSAC